jgi:hypothetical protein
MAKTTSIPSHVLPLSKARLAYNRILSVTVVLETGKGKAKDGIVAGRFSSTNSFKNRNPFRDAGEELVDGREVIFLQFGEVAKISASVIPEARYEARS